MMVSYLEERGADRQADQRGIPLLAPLVPFLICRALASVCA